MPNAPLRLAPVYSGTGAPTQASFAPLVSTATVSGIATQLAVNYWTSNGEAPARFDTRPGKVLNVDLSGLGASGKALALLALDSWSQVTGILFNTAPPVGSFIHISFTENEEGAFSTSAKSGSLITSSRVNVSTDWVATYGTDAASYSLQTYIHEIGHALGLGHAGNYNGDSSYPDGALFAADSWQMSIMSYFSQSENTTTGADFAWVLSPQLADIRAMEMLYGVNSKAGYGSTVYGVGSTAGQVNRLIGQMMATGVLAEPVAFTIVDHNGTDLIDLSTDMAAQVINLMGGAISSVYGLAGNMLIEAATVIENLRAGHGSDAIRGNAAANQIWASDGADTVEGGDGADSIYGGAGADALLGGLGSDSLDAGVGADWLSGEDGDDRLYGGGDEDTLLGGLGNDAMYGGDGLDRLEGGDGNDLVVGDGGTDQLYGGAGADKLYGGTGDDSLWGDAGNDTLYGGDGVDALDGGEGNDAVYGDAGAETLFGGAGDDKLYGGADADDLYGGMGNELLDGGDGADILRGEAGNDSLTGGTGADTLLGDIGSDLLSGGTGNDTLYGGAGDDNLRGESDADLLDGGAGNDALDGGAGNDTLIGGSGTDVLTGGLGADVFVFAAGDTGLDTAKDFSSGTDKIALGDAHLSQMYGLIGGGAFGHHAGEVRFTVSRSGIAVEVDFDGDGTADLGFTLSKAAILLASDFL